MVSNITSSAKRVPSARLLYTALLLCTILLGLATRRFPLAFPQVVSRYGGDTLWAMMIVWLIALLSPRMRTVTLGLSALAVCILVETSQLYHAAWIDALRATRMGALALGHGFLWSDVFCYVAGVFAAVIIRQLVMRAR